MAKDKPWHDEQTLRTEYIENKKSRRELAEQWGCSADTIRYWQEKYGIESRDVGGVEKDAAYRDKETLEELYVEKGMSFTEVAEELGCAVATVQRWMDKHGIQSRKAPQDPTHPPYHGFRNPPDSSIGEEYEIVSTHIDGVNQSVPVHRLIAVGHGKLDPSEFWDSEIHIHHKSGHGLDNRPENLERLDRSEHTKLHSPWEDSSIIGKQ